MSKPTKEIRRARRAGGRDEVWRYVRTARPGFTIADLMAHERVEYSTAVKWLRRLADAGVISVETTPGRAGTREERVNGTNHYTLETDLGPETPVISADGAISTRQPGSGQAAMWRAMRVLKRFELVDILVSLDGTRYPTSQSTLENYAWVLQRAGYLRVVRRGGGVGVKALYQMIRDTGPLAPSVRGISEAVYDNNEHRIVWSRDEEGADA